MMLFKLILNFHFTFVSISHYYPDVKQCWGDPTITAYGSKIDTVALRNGQLKWCALSRDMLSRWGGKYNYGDSIYISGLGWYEVHDCMNARWAQKIDVLSYDRVGMTKSSILDVQISFK
jgi:hypothetical protein